MAETVPAVLLVIFNRPEPTRRVLDAVRAARPTRLYVAADGPRPSRPHEAALCAATRAVVTSGVDWPCELHLRFSDENLGCSLGVLAGINWFFEQEMEGIILEDDCVPGADFFPFCQEVLTRYRHDTRVMHVGGNNFSREARHAPAPHADSYFFSGQVNTWGWATWRRAWQHYDFHFAQLPALRQRQLLSSMYHSPVQRLYWLRQFEKVRRTVTPHIWDYQWHFTVAANSGLTIVPAVNLVQNIGFGADATHTVSDTHRLTDLPIGNLPFPLRHPTPVLRDWARDQRHFREFLLGRAVAKAWRLLSPLERWWQGLRSQPAAPETPRPTAPPAPAPTFHSSRSISTPV